MNFQKLNIANLHPTEYNPRNDLKPADSEYQKIKRCISEIGESKKQATVKLLPERIKNSIWNFAHKQGSLKETFQALFDFA